MIRTMRTVVWLGIAVAVCAGCSRASLQPSAAQRASIRSAVATQPTAPTIVSVATTVGPKIPFKEIRLPAGYRITDTTNRLATVDVPTKLDYPSKLIGLLDLKSGAARVVLKQPVKSDERFWVASPRLSDSWLAWEEVSPNEANDMSNAEWRLYAAPILAHGARIGKPTLVDAGNTSYRQRPMYSVDDSTVYWTRIEHPGGIQEYVERHGAVLSRNMKTGAERTIFDSPAEVASFKMSADGAVLALGTPKLNGATAEIVVVDPASASVCNSMTIDVRGGLSHFADATGGSVTWATFASAGDMWPDAFIADPEGRIDMCAQTGLDACFAGDLVFFEGNQAPRVGHTLEEKLIWGYDPKKRVRFELLKTTSDDAAAGWWQPVTPSRRNSVFVVWNDIGIWGDPVEDLLLVRVYDVSGATVR